MAANTEPIFTITPNIGQAISTGTANTASDGSGSMATLFTAGINGSRIERITYQNAQNAPAASSAMLIKIFLTNTSGENPRLLSEIAVPAATRTASAVGASGTLLFTNGLVIPSGTLVKVAQSVYAGDNDLMHFTAEGGNF